MIRTLLRLILGAALLLLAASPAPPPVVAGETGRVLVVSNPATGLSERLPLAGVTRLTIRFFHSYDRHWVSESFAVAGGRLVPVEVDYADDTYDYRDTRYQSQATVERERVRLSHIQPAPSDRLREIITRVAFTKPQQLILAGPGESRRATPFTKWGEPGQRIVFTLE